MAGDFFTKNYIYYIGFREASYKFKANCNKFSPNLFKVYWLGVFVGALCCLCVFYLLISMSYGCFLFLLSHHSNVSPSLLKFTETPHTLRLAAPFSISTSTKVP